MPTMHVAQVSRAGGPFEIVERDIPEPGAGQVRVKVEACGICHSDAMTKEGLFPGIQFPRVPGHEVVGVIDAIGAEVPQWKVGQRVGVGWHGWHCGVCDRCRRGDFFACLQIPKVTGISYDGGYGEYLIAFANGLALLPEGLSPIEAAPLMCAGLTTFNALRHSGARPGDTVAVLGLGGLGHLGVQYAVKMGFKTIAIARGADKEALAKQLGAHDYIDSQANDPATALQKVGGARIVLATVTNADAMAATIGGLSPLGSLMVLGAPHEPLQVPAMPLIIGKRSVQGWYSGTSIDAQDTLGFSALTGVRAMNEVYPLEKVNEAYERMMSGKARFRVVLKIA
ncbi:MAG TPA: alcohol dehydrogenase [Candidatus Hydrogenedentes bacterium]|nr:alcohol dehydrogenase [Candidatus Hydrogenedentota bacterium]